jgi:hypothetical protein
MKPVWCTGIILPTCPITNFCSPHWKNKKNPDAPLSTHSIAAQIKKNNPYLRAGSAIGIEYSIPIAHSIKSQDLVP